MRVSGIYSPELQESSGIALTQLALADHVGEWGRSFVSIALMLFAFSSMIYNYYLGENSLNFFSEENKTLFNGFRVLTLLLVLWGSLQDLSSVFAFADVTMGLLAVVNLAAVLLLIKVGLRVICDFDEQRRAGIEQPIFDSAKFADLDIDRDAWPPVQPPAATTSTAAS
jgi:AGCS family alanine or glycine:cation symporter